MSDNIFIWNETLAEQVRYQTARAMKGQAEDIRQSAERFRAEATQHEEQADRIESRLPITIDVREQREDHQGGTYYRWSREIDPVATRREEERIREMREQAREVNRAADELKRAAEELERAAEELDRLFRELYELTQNTDATYAARIAAIKEEIRAYIRHMESIRDSFGIGFTSLLGDGPQTLSSLATAALLVINPQMASKMAGVQGVCASGLDPINLATGNFYYTKEDIIIPGRYPLVFTRFYNAIGGFDCVLGQNWTHNYNIRLHNEDEKQLRISFEDGRTERYDRIAENRYVSPIDGRNTLAVLDDGSSYALILQDMSQLRFDNTGALRQMIDTNGNTTFLEYEENSLLSKVHNPSGSLSFSYNSYNENSRLVQVTDHIGRQVYFDYEENNLTKVTHPNGATYQYEYGNHGLINKIINPLDITAVHNEYDENGRAIRQQMADGGLAHIKYNDANMSNTTIEPNGNKIEYYRDERYRTTRIAYEHFDERFVFNNKNNCTQYTDRNKNNWRYEYDMFSNVTKKIDPLGNVTEMEYSDLNKPTKINNPNGGQVTMNYDDWGNMTSTTDPLGRESSFVYDEYGQLITQTLADKSQSNITYDTRGNITTITDSQGTTISYEYDALNRVAKTINGEGHATTYEYNVNGDITKATDAQGKSRHYEYNLSGKVTRITDFNGGIVEYKYHPIGKVEEITDQQGGTTKITYDLMQNITSVTDPTGSTIQYEYDQYSRVARTIDPEGHATTYKHDPNGNVISAISPLGAEVKITYDALNRQKSVIEPDGATTKLTYDKQGNITGTTDAQGNTTTREYDTASQLISITDPLGNKTNLTYTALRQIETMTNPKGETHTYSYYPGGRLKSITLPEGETETYEYNKTGKVSKVIDALGNATILTYDSLSRIITTTNPQGHSKHFEYDAIGNITSITDENGNTTRFKYSPLGDIVEVTDPTGHSTKYSYDAARRLTQLHQYNNQGDPQITTYNRNKKGEVVSTTSPLGDMVKYTYDAVGNVTAKLDEDSQETLYDYNLAGKLEKITYADGKTVAFTYNALKQLTEMQDWLGTTKIETDALGRTTKTTDHEGNQVAYTYNSAGQREKLTYPDGKEVSYQYNISGRLESVAADNEITRYIYDPAGRISQRILPEGTTTNYQFNPLGALTSLTHSKEENILDQFKYTYDPGGNITQIEKHRTSLESDNGIFHYTYDPLNRLIQATNPQTTKTYTYDPLGNRIASQQNGIETRHTFNKRNQLIKTLEGDTTTNYTYDNRGNLTQKISNDKIIASYTYDATNMMVSAHNPAKGTAEYTYDGFRNRVKKLESFHNHQAITDTSTTDTNLPDPTKDVRYILDMTKPYDNLLMSQGQNTQPQNYIWGTSLLSAKQNDNNLHYLQDHLGSPIRLLSTDSETPLAYDEFGVPTADSMPNTNPFGFTGYQLDEITNMHYAQARYYNSATGRFTTEDPIKDKLNWYGYCNANPTTSVDLTGLFDGRLSMDDYSTEISQWNSRNNNSGGGPVSIAPVDFEIGNDGRPVYTGTASTAGAWSTSGSTTQNNRPNNECTIRSIAPIDFDFKFCGINGLTFVCVGTGQVSSLLQPPQPITGVILCVSVTWVQRGEFERALTYLKQSETFRDLWDTLQNSGETITVAFSGGFQTFYWRYTNTVFWDPTHGLVINGTYVQSGALGLAHELGHAAQHVEEHPYFMAWIADSDTPERLRLENDNLSRFETPIALELGEFMRANYADASGTFRMDNSTDWGILHTRPSWHYTNPLIWGQPRITLENKNTWTPGWSKYVDLFNTVDDEYEQQE